ncbi:MAG: Ig-like domain-containing protein [Spirochaetes bacterium]|nr:Ig-like domain-containing protein [Spirochaetota bacterium]
MSSFKILLIFIILLLFTGCSWFWVDMKPPEVESHYPGHNQYDVPHNACVWIKFTKPMDTITVQRAFSIDSDGNTTGTFGWDNNTLYYFFEAFLDTGRKYTVNLDKNAMDKAGNTLTRGLMFTFYVNHLSPQKPSVVQTIPANLAEGVGKDTDIIITFSKSMDKASVQNNFSISPSMNGLFIWSHSDTMLTYQTTEELQSSTWHKVTIGKDSKDKDGYSLGDDFSMDFLTGDSYSHPAVLGVYSYGKPLTNFWTNYQKNIEKDERIAVQFSKNMSHSDSQNAFSLSPSVNGYFTWISGAGETMIFHPTEDLDSETTYRLNISTSAKDTDNHNLEDPFELYFVTDGPGCLVLKLTNVSDNQGNRLSFENVTTVDLNGFETNTFAVHFDLAAPNQLDISSFQQHVSISRISGWGDSSKLGAIEDFNYNGDLTKAYIRIGSVSSNNYYRLKFDGSSSGIRDLNGNSMQDDVQVIFLTK